MLLSLSVKSERFMRSADLLPSPSTILFPLISVLFVAPLSPVVVQREAQIGLAKVLGTVWLPGFGSALSTIGFGAMIALKLLDLCSTKSSVRLRLSSAWCRLAPRLQVRRTSPFRPRQ
jgi:hypothetical protein